MKFGQSMIVGMIALGAAAASPAHAETAGNEEPASCTAADAATQSKLDAVLAGHNIPADLPVGDLIVSLRRARVLCLEGHPERGLLVYIRVSDALRDALAANRRSRALNLGSTR